MDGCLIWWLWWLTLYCVYVTIKLWLFYMWGTKTLETNCYITSRLKVSCVWIWPTDLCFLPLQWQTWHTCRHVVAWGNSSGTIWGRRRNNLKDKWKLYFLARRLSNYKISTPKKFSLSLKECWTFALAMMKDLFQAALLSLSDLLMCPWARHCPRLKPHVSLHAPKCTKLPGMSLWC